MKSISYASNLDRLYKVAVLLSEVDFPKAVKTSSRRVDFVFRQISAVVERYFRLDGLFRNSVEWKSSQFQAGWIRGRGEMQLISNQIKKKREEYLCNLELEKKEFFWAQKLKVR